MTEKDEFLVGLGKRLRELRLHLGYETAASFARAIGYPPRKYSRYERHGCNHFVSAGPERPLIRATGQCVRPLESLVAFFSYLPILGISGMKPLGPGQ